MSEWVVIAYFIIGALLYVGIWVFAKERLLRESVWSNAWVMLACLTMWPIMFGVPVFQARSKRGAP